MLLFQLLILTFISLVSNAQGITLEAVDSLKNKTPIELANLIKSSEAKESKIYEEALESFHKNDLNTAELYLKLGWIFYKKKYFEKSIDYAKKANRIGNTLDNENLVFKSYILSGATYLREGKHQHSFDNYYQAASIAERQRNLENSIIANSGRILVLQKMNKLDMALEVSKETLRSIEKSSFKNGKNHVRILTNINEVYLDKEKYDSVLFYAQKGIELSEKLDYKEGLVDLYIKKGIVFYYKNFFDQAFDNLNKANDILQRYDIGNELFPIVKVNYYIAGCFYKQHNYDMAISYLCKTMDYIDEGDLGKLPVIQSHLLLANCYFKNKEYEQAHYWENLYGRLNNIYQEDKDITVDKIYKRETEKYEEEITKLKSRETIINYLLVTFVIISLILLFIGFRYYKKQQSNKMMFSELIEKINFLEIEKNKKETKSKNTHIVINDNKVAEILKNLDKLEDQEYFLKTECSLRTTAQKAKTNTTYLTKVIHEHKGKNFNDYLTDLRIEYALQRLKNDKKFRAFSVKSIAADIGYKSDDAFAKRFREKTGLNPSYYIKKIEKL